MGLIAPHLFLEIMEKKDRADLLRAISIMLKNNPGRESSHETEDWVIENYIDRVRELNQKLEPHIIGHFWYAFNKNLTLLLNSYENRHDI